MKPEGGHFSLSLAGEGQGKGEAPACGGPSSSHKLGHTTRRDGQSHKCHQPCPSEQSCKWSKPHFILQNQPGSSNPFQSLNAPRKLPFDPQAHTTGALSLPTAPFRCEKWPAHPQMDGSVTEAKNEGARAGHVGFHSPHHHFTAM